MATSWTSALKQALPANMGRSCDIEVEQAYRNGWHMDPAKQYCPRCGVSAGSAGFHEKGCSFCVKQRIQWDRIVRISSYTGQVAHWIISMKFRRDWSWATWFAEQLADPVRDKCVQDRSVICPVPMHWLRRVRRGYNQAHLMSIALSRATAIPWAALLKRTRYTHPQLTVAPTKRQENVLDSFATTQINLDGWHIWLVDDVKTTGATLNACARLLRRSGAKFISVAVAAVANPQETHYRNV